MVSTLFGMMMAVASDLPKLEDRTASSNRDSLDDARAPLGLLTGNQRRISSTQRRSRR